MPTGQEPQMAFCGAESDRGALQPSDGLLPELRQNVAVDKNKPLPTSLQSDFIPEEILFALTQPPAAKDKLGPPTRSRNLNVSGVGFYMVVLKDMMI